MDCYESEDLKNALFYSAPMKRIGKHLMGTTTQFAIKSVWSNKKGDFRTRINVDRAEAFN